MIIIFSINHSFKNLSIYIWESFLTISNILVSSTSLWPSNVRKCQKSKYREHVLLNIRPRGWAEYQSRLLKNTQMCALIMPISADWLSQLPVFKSFRSMVEQILPIRFDIKKNQLILCYITSKKWKGNQSFGLEWTYDPRPGILTFVIKIFFRHFSRSYSMN